MTCILECCNDEVSLIEAFKITYYVDGYFPQYSHYAELSSTLK